MYNFKKKRVGLFCLQNILRKRKGDQIFDHYLHSNCKKSSNPERYVLDVMINENCHRAYLLKRRNYPSKRHIYFGMIMKPYSFFFFTIFSQASCYIATICSCYLYSQLSALLFQKPLTCLEIINCSTVDGKKVSAFFSE